MPASPGGRTAICAFLDGKESPYERHEQMSAEREKAIALALGRLSARGWGKFIRLLETARHAARAAKPEDVFWLTLDEIRTALTAPKPLTIMVAERQRNNQAWSKVNPHYLLPVGSRPAFWWR